MSSPGGDTYRLEAFADAVFAIAITLLIIEIRLPPHDELVALGGLGPALRHLWPSYLVAISLSIVVGLAILYMLPRAGAHAAAGALRTEAIGPRAGLVPCAA